jgi:hypothetical protein
LKNNHPNGEIVEDRTAFVILTHGRSGSSLLRSALGQHPQVAIYDELFSEEFKHRDRIETQDGWRRYRDGDDAAMFAHTCFRGPYPQAVRAVGFKLFYNQVRATPGGFKLWDYLKSNKHIKIIRLIRRNLFASWVSHEVMHRTRLWNIGTNSNRTVRFPKPFVIQENVLRGYLEEVTKCIRSANKDFAHHQTMTVEYETGLCENFQKTINGVHQFLGLTRAKARPDFIKLATRPLSLQVKNYSELVKTLRRSRFSFYID